MEAEFWEYMEKLVVSTSITIDRPKGISHPRYPDMVYPVNYGYFEGTRSPDNSGIDVWTGSNSKKLMVSWQQSTLIRWTAKLNS